MIEWLIYIAVLIFAVAVFYFYIGKIKKESARSTHKIEQAKEAGTFEPISLHPHIDTNTCIRSGACLKACPEHDVIGIVNGRATLVNASLCIGHGACFHACPVEAISLRIGTEKRGVDLPHLNQNFETNVQGIFIAGELGGMSLIKNAVEQGKQAMDAIVASLPSKRRHPVDVIIVGAGPAGIAAALQEKKSGVKYLLLEQDTLGGTVFSFPREKIVMTAPMDLPLYGKIKLFQTKKAELLQLWSNVFSKHEIEIKENQKVEKILMVEDGFEMNTNRGLTFYSHKVLLCLGRRGTPRKLGVPGEHLEKVAYRCLEPERILNRKIMVVGGGDSAIENALLLSEHNTVSLSYRSDKFSRLKPQNKINIESAIASDKIKIYFNSQIVEIEPDKIKLNQTEKSESITLENDLVFIFAGGELPTQFLQNAGIEIKKRFGYTVKSHAKS